MVVRIGPIVVYTAPNITSFKNYPKHLVNWKLPLKNNISLFNIKNNILNTFMHMDMENLKVVLVAWLQLQG